MKSASLSNYWLVLKFFFFFFFFFFGGGGNTLCIMLQCIEGCILILPVSSCLLLFCSLASYMVPFNMLNLGEDSIPSIH